MSDSDSKSNSPNFSHLSTFGIPRVTKYGSRTMDLSIFEEQTEINSGESAESSLSDSVEIKDTGETSKTSVDASSDLSNPPLGPFSLPISPDEARELYLAEMGLTVGRPSTLTPERHKFIIDQIRSGVPAKVACGLAGVHNESVNSWAHKGKTHIKAGIDSIFSRFAIDLLIARNELEAKLALKWAKIVSEPTTKRKQVYREQLITKEDGTTEVVKYLESDTIELTGDGDWRGIAEFMSRRYPDRWKRTERIEQSGPDGGPIQIVQASIDVDKMSPEARELLWREIKQIQGAIDIEGGEERKEEREGEE